MGRPAPSPGNVGPRDGPDATTPAVLRANFERARSPVVAKTPFWGRDLAEFWGIAGA